MIRIGYWGLMYFKSSSNMRDSFMPDFEVNLHFFEELTNVGSPVYTLASYFIIWTSSHGEFVIFGKII